MKQITKTTREKFKQWNNAIEKLSEEDKNKEIKSWIISALNILEENEKETEKLIL